MKGDELVAIVEHRGCERGSAEDRFVQWRVMALAGKSALAILDKIGNDNAKGEYYLTDAVTVARGMGLRALVRETHGRRSARHQHQVTTRRSGGRHAAEIASGGDGRRRHDDRAGNGVPRRDTKFGKDVTVEPYVVFGPGVSVGDGAVIHAFSHIRGRRSARASRSGLTRGCGRARICVKARASAISSR